MNLELLGSARLRWWSHAQFLVAFLVPLIACSGEPKGKTYTFKTLDSPTNQLHADVHRPPGNTVRPVIVFSHGGSLMMCGRTMSPKRGALWGARLNTCYDGV